MNFTATTKPALESTHPDQVTIDREKQLQEEAVVELRRMLAEPDNCEAFTLYVAA